MVLYAGTVIAVVAKMRENQVPKRMCESFFLRNLWVGSHHTYPMHVGVEPARTDLPAHCASHLGACLASPCLAPISHRNLLSLSCYFR